MKYVIATAGHVDHGKSSLVKAISGMNPDRLAEEQQRQMTIDLGFAWFTLPSGDEVGIVDVPGHRDFISNMLAGVGSIDAVIIVVAADEGVMPQTIEHIMILDLLEVKRGLIAVTKTDLIQDQDWLGMVEKDIREAIRDTNLRNFPFVYVSAVTGAGIAELLEMLQKILAAIERKREDRDAHLAIDRVFSMKGFGTVVTGTLLGGALEVGTDVEILPAEKRGRIRGIETHKQKLDRALPGSRVALNINGVDVSEIKRGDVVVKPQTVKPTFRLDAQVRIIPSASGALKHNDSIKLYHGTAEINARVRTLGKDAIMPGEDGLVQLELQAPIIAWKGDRFILRRPSPQETIGGGQIINAASQRRYKRYSEKTLRSLSAQNSGSVWEIYTLLVEEKGVVPGSALEQSLLKEGFDFSDEKENLVIHDEFIQFFANCPKKDPVQFYTTKSKLNAMAEKINADLLLAYKDSPLIPGIPLSLMSEKLGISDCILEVLIDQGFLGDALISKKGYLCKKDRMIQFSEKDLRKIERLDILFEKEPFAPPSPETIQAITGNDLYQALIFMDKIIPIADSIVFRDKECNVMKSGLIKYLEEQGEITLAQFRDMFGTSRKYALAFLEYMDRLGITVRVDEVRKLKRIGIDKS